MQDERSTRRRVRIGPNLYQRPSDGKFELGFTDSLGRWRIKTLRAATRTEARAERDSFLTQLRRGEAAAASKITLREVAEEYLSTIEALVANGERGERTYERYSHALRHHVLPALGDRVIQKVTADHVADLFAAARTKGLAPWTIKGIQTPLRRVFALAVRRGYLADSPMSRLATEELPKGKAQHPPRTLTRPEIHRLLDAAPTRYRPLIAVAVFSGLRTQEILGLRWGDIDFKGGVIRVRKQLTRGTKDKPARLVALKTKSGSRDVVLLGELATLLQTHLRQTVEKRGIPHSAAFVFASSEGTPLNYNNVAKRGLDRAATDAGLTVAGEPKLGFHDLRHTFASHLIRQGIDPVRASRQLGHSRPSVTLDIYAHEFEEARGRDDISEKLTAAFSGLLDART